MDWLEQHPDALPILARHTRVPIAVATMDSFLWANEAWEQMLDYTLVELREKSWQAITASPEDAEYDSQMARELSQSDTRLSYEFRKSYRRKDGQLVPVVIHVQRWPIQGPFRAFLVTAMPVESTAALVVQKLAEFQAELANWQEANGAAKDPAFWPRVMEFCKAHPLIAGTAAAILSTLLFGRSALEIIKEAIAVFGGGITP